MSEQKDIIERLRERAPLAGSPGIENLIIEAAADIETLRLEKEVLVHEVAAANDLTKCLQDMLSPEQLSEAFHTALRKGSESEQSSIAWRAINDMDDEDWKGIIDFAIDGLKIQNGMKF